MEKQRDNIKLRLASSQDPLGIREVRLGGAGPSLRVEAEIVSRLQTSNNGNGGGNYGNGRTEEKKT